MAWLAKVLVETGSQMADDYQNRPDGQVRLDKSNKVVLLQGPKADDLHNASLEGANYGSLGKVKQSRR